MRPVLDFSACTAPWGGRAPCREAIRPNVDVIGAIETSMSGNTILRAGTSGLDETWYQRLHLTLTPEEAESLGHELLARGRKYTICVEWLDDGATLTAADLHADILARWRQHNDWNEVLMTLWIDDSAAWCEVDGHKTLIAIAEGV